MQASINGLALKWPCEDGRDLRKSLLGEKSQWKVSYYISVRDSITEFLSMISAFVEQNYNREVPLQSF
jgi:hypothetical protein